MKEMTNNSQQIAACGLYIVEPAKSPSMANVLDVSPQKETPLT